MPALGGDMIRPRWPLPMGNDDIQCPAGQIIRTGGHGQSFQGIDARLILQRRGDPPGLKRDLVDGLDSGKFQVPVVRFALYTGAFNEVALLEAVFLYQVSGYKGVFRSRQKIIFK